MTSQTSLDTIPEEELRADRRETLDDIALCRLALSQGITSYSGGLVQERLEANERILTIIDGELSRRGLV